MSEEYKENKNLIQYIFEKTNTKVSEDDPSVALVLGIRDILKENIQDYEEKITSLNHQQLIDIQTEIEYALASIKTQLDDSNEYYVGNSTNHEKNLTQAFQILLDELESKHKDLNFILNKIQAEYSKASDERFEHYIAKIEALHAKELQRQYKKDATKGRDILFVSAGFVAGVMICLLIVFW